MGYLAIERDQVGQVGPALPKPMLAWSGCPVHAGDGTQDDLLHGLSQPRRQTDRPVVPHILIPAFLVDGHHIC